jgi:hypothetical protein
MLAMSRIRHELGKLCARRDAALKLLVRELFLVLNNEEHSLQALPSVLEAFQEKWVKCYIGAQKVNITLQ